MCPFCPFLGCVASGACSLTCTTARVLLSSQKTNWRRKSRSPVPPGRFYREPNCWSLGRAEWKRARLGQSHARAINSCLFLLPVWMLRETSAVNEAAALARRELSLRRLPPRDARVAEARRRRVFGSSLAAQRACRCGSAYHIVHGFWVSPPRKSCWR